MTISLFATPNSHREAHEDRASQPIPSPVATCPKSLMPERKPRRGHRHAASHIFEHCLAPLGRAYRYRHYSRLLSRCAICADAQGDENGDAAKLHARRDGAATHCSQLYDGRIAFGGARRRDAGPEWNTQQRNRSANESRAIRDMKISGKSSDFSSFYHRSSSPHGDFDNKESIKKNARCWAMPARPRRAGKKDMIAGAASDTFNFARLVPR